MQLELQQLRSEWKAYHHESKPRFPINNVTQTVSKKDVLPRRSCWPGGVLEENSLPINNVIQKIDNLGSSSLHGGKDVDSHTKWQYKIQLHCRYQLADRKEKTIILDELIKNKVFKNRKAATRAMNKKGDIPYRYSERGRKRVYNDIDIEYLIRFWRLTRRMNSKRLKAAMPEWFKKLPGWPNQVKEKLLKMSPSTIDKYLKVIRKQDGLKLRSQTTPAKKHIKRIIQLRDPSEIIDKPGFGQSDTVVHCGDYNWGLFAGSVTFTDILSGWTEGYMILGKKAKQTVNALEDIELRLPIKLHSLYFDNGCEFINHEMVNAFKTSRKNPIDLKRAREQRKNDQCYIEQKNNVFVRELLKYDRIDKQEVVDMVNEVYRIEWSLLFNYFYPQMKLIEKDRYGAKYRKKYDKPKTPYHRLMISKDVHKEIKKSLETKTTA